jgi:hypothetical protein
MKILKSVAFLLLSSIVIFSGCKDDNDTVVSQTRTQILTAKTWQVDELARNIGGVVTQYFRGGTNTTGSNYQFTRIKFNADGTGTYTDDQDDTFPMTWTFMGSDQRKLRLDITGFVQYDWILVELCDNYLHQTSIGGNSMLTTRMIQIP